MGLDVYAYTFVGIKVSEKDLKEEKVEKMLVHHSASCHYSGKTPVCPKCGKPWKEKRTVLDFKSFVTRDDDEEPFVGKYPIMVNGETEEFEWYIAIPSLVNHTNSHRHSHNNTESFSLSGLDEKRKKMQAALEPLGLWNDATFGVHTFLVISV